ncbi:MAG: ABC transporter substrate-binding protein [Sphingorhabdus sp.]
MIRTRLGSCTVWSCLLAFFAIGSQAAALPRQSETAHILADTTADTANQNDADPITSVAIENLSARSPDRTLAIAEHDLYHFSELQTVAEHGVCQTQEMPQPVEVRIGYLKLANAQLVAKAMALHEKAMCVPIRWIGFETGGQVNAAIAAGKIDFGAMGGPPASIGVTHNLGYRGILLLNMLQGVEGLVVRPAMATPEGLAGKRIATPFGSTSHYLLNILLKQAGVSPDSVSLVDMTPDQAAAAWGAGHIHAAYVWEPALGRMVAQGGKILVDNSEMADRGYPMWDISVVSDAFARAHPGLVTSYVRSECAAIDTWRTNPRVATAAVAQELALPPAEARRMMTGMGVIPCSQQTDPAYLGDGSKPGRLTRSIYDMAVFLRDNGRTQIVASPADYEALIDTRYLMALNGSSH